MVRSIVGLSQRGGRVDRLYKRPTKLRIEKWGSGVGNKPFWKVFHGPTNFFDATRHVPRLSIQFEWDWKVFNEARIRWPVRQSVLNGIENRAKALTSFQRWRWPLKSGPTPSLALFSTGLDKRFSERWTKCPPRRWTKGGQSVYLSSRPSSA